MFLGKTVQNVQRVLCFMHIRMELIFVQFWILLELDKEDQLLYYVLYNINYDLPCSVMLECIV